MNAACNYDCYYGHIFVWHQSALWLDQFGPKHWTQLYMKLLKMILSQMLIRVYYFAKYLPWFYHSFIFSVFILLITLEPLNMDSLHYIYTPAS